MSKFPNTLKNFPTASPRILIHPPGEMLRNLIFDWSGTLADDLGPVIEATNLIFRHYGKPELLLEEFRERFCLPFDSFYEEHLPGVGLPEIEPLFHAHFVERQHAVALLPHALEFLLFCRATGRRLFLLSASKDAHVAEQMARLGVTDFFEKTYVGVMDKRERIRLMLGDHQLVACETAFIGDMVHDVETARHGGVRAIATLTGYDSAEKLGRARPDVMVRDLGELRALLEATSPNDEIRIEELEIFARVGVSEDERAAPQRLTVSLTLQPRHRFVELADDLARTVDYAAVCAEVERFIAGREDKLIETLAQKIADHLLERFTVVRVEVELRKFILPQTKYVAVRLAR